MHIKIRKAYRNVVSLCDSELLGKKFEEGRLQLDIRENFYKGEEVTEKKAVKLLQQQKTEDATFNIIGEESVETAIKADIITRESVGKIANIPYALFLL